MRQLSQNRVKMLPRSKCHEGDHDNTSCANDRIVLHISGDLKICNAYRHATRGIGCAWEASSRNLTTLLPANSMPVFEPAYILQDR